MGQYVLFIGAGHVYLQGSPSTCVLFEVLQDLHLSISVVLLQGPDRLHMQEAYSVLGSRHGTRLDRSECHVT
ncbi:hypothetical protein GDO81_016491 [Engystomops pustulosus]|uniref:Uncharacterized protein n=1 Tax=Engystomops pustulosus TaxID=76066 RepID=A0AAV7ASF2_ENGPU|nr:hypothetical protein GDO81_016491 [Engystomops pustulosus]